MPAAKTPQKEKPKVPQATAAPSADVTDISPSGLIALAKKLERQRSEVMKEIDDVRVMLRRFDRLGALTEEQGEWLDAFFPQKERGERRSKDAIETTRKLREAARKDGDA